MAAKPERRFKVVADNRKARFNYEIGETFEAGIALTGSEVKSLRAGKATIAESYADAARRRDLAGQLQYSGIPAGEPLQPSRPSGRASCCCIERQINKLAGAVEREGMTIVPLKLYFNERGRAKVEIALGQRQEAARQARDREEALLGSRARPADAGEGLRPPMLISAHQRDNRALGVARLPKTPRSRADSIRKTDRGMQIVPTVHATRRCGSPAIAGRIGLVVVAAGVDHDATSRRRRTPNSVCPSRA